MLGNCDSLNEYCLNFDVYTGKNHCENSRFGLGFDVVSNLAQEYLHKFHCICTNRFFNEIDIAELLKRNSTYACGTIWSNRKGLPKRIKRLKLKIIEDFNINMERVVLNDHLCTYYKAGRPSHKCWRYVFLFLMNVSVTNPWIFFTKSGRAAGYTHVKFTMEFAEL